MFPEKPEVAMFKSEFHATQSTENQNNYQSFEFSEIEIHPVSQTLPVVSLLLFIGLDQLMATDYQQSSFWKNLVVILLEHHLTDLSQFIIVVDFNFHVDDKESKNVCDLLNLLE